MRAVADDVIENGGEWSIPAANFTLPAQPATVNDNDFNMTSFTYRYEIHSFLQTSTMP